MTFWLGVLAGAVGMVVIVFILLCISQPQDGE